MCLFVVQITPFSYIWEKLWGVHHKPFYVRCLVRTPVRELLLLLLLLLHGSGFA
jgi:hypothetical protein